MKLLFECLVYILIKMVNQLAKENEKFYYLQNVTNI